MPNYLIPLLKIAVKVSNNTYLFYPISQTLTLQYTKILISTKQYFSAGGVLI